MYSNLLNSENISVFILTFIAGLLIARIIRARGIGGCFTYIIAILVIILIITGLLKGYSFFIERITYSLENYIYYNFIGIIGAIFGFMLGLLIFGKR